ncbi:MAG: hypothetical protein KAX18_01920 [Candidatus Lokiarchaeota archaeon]|nr:hypothetical protein [Candidatus Lokiarchaeota archaeon]
MKRQIYYYISQIVALIVLIQIIDVYANPIPLEPIENPVLRIVALTIVFMIGTFFEYRLLKLDDEEIQLRKKELLWPVFKVNLVTYPLTQILAYIVYIYILLFFWLYVLVIEIAVVIIEWQLLKIELHKINDRIPSKEILIQMIKVNFVSFLVGLIAFIPLEYL